MKEIPSRVVYEDDICLAFEDLNPQAPLHVLFIPKKHIDSLEKAEVEDFEIISKMFKAMKNFALEQGFSQDGYRIVNNCNQMGGQTVYHLHFHMLAKRNLSWPPG
jgi:histidine triad (HIT) family protein